MSLVPPVHEKRWGEREGRGREGGEGKVEKGEGGEGKKGRERKGERKGFKRGRKEKEEERRKRRKEKNRQSPSLFPSLSSTTLQLFPSIYFSLLHYSSTFPSIYFSLLHYSSTFSLYLLLSPPLLFNFFPLSTCSLTNSLTRLSPNSNSHTGTQLT